MSAISAITIRQVAPGDFEQWLPLWQGCNTTRDGHQAVAAEVTETTWSRFLDENSPVHCLVADVRGQLVGTAHFIFHHSTKMVSSICYLQDLYVATDARRQGIGRALVFAVLDYARTAGSARVYWQTHKRNVIAQRLYGGIAERSGYIVYRKNL
jgi:GNAT superfamily N-acetyltransferase